MRLERADSADHRACVVFKMSSYWVLTILLLGRTGCIGISIRVQILQLQERAQEWFFRHRNADPKMGPFSEPSSFTVSVLFSQAMTA